MHDTPNPAPLITPRGDLFADPAAAVVWAAISELPEADKHKVYDYLAAHLQVSSHGRNPHQQRVARAISALRDAHELLLAEPVDSGGDDQPPSAVATAGADPGDSDAGKPRLTQHAFRRLHAEHGDRLGWPPESSVRRWLGGTWNDALRVAALAPVVDGDVLVREIGRALSREEVIAAVVACAQETQDPIPSFHRYLWWAKRDDVRRRPGRRPTSQGPIDRLFGGWPKLLVAAGLVTPDAHGTIPAGGETSSDAGGGVSVFRRAAYSYSDEALHAAMNEIAQRVGHSPGTAEYQAERQKIFEEERAAGLPARALPSLGSQRSRYVNWDDALQAAGLARRNGRHNKVGCGTRAGGGRQRYNDREYAIALREGYQAIGNPFTQRAYDAWRKEQTERDRAERRYRRLPGFYAIWLRFGTWAIACREILSDWNPDTDPVDPGEGWTSPVTDTRDTKLHRNGRASS